MTAGTQVIVNGTTLPLVVIHVSENGGFVTDDGRAWSAKLEALDGSGLSVRAMRNADTAAKLKREAAGVFTRLVHEALLRNTSAMSYHELDDINRILSRHYGKETRGGW